MKKYEYKQYPPPHTFTSLEFKNLNCLIYVYLFNFTKVIIYTTNIPHPLRKMLNNDPTVKRRSKALSLNIFIRQDDMGVKTNYFQD